MNVDCTCASTSSLEVSPFHSHLPSGVGFHSEGKPADPVAASKAGSPTVAMERAGNPRIDVTSSHHLRERNTSTACSRTAGSLVTAYLKQSPLSKWPAHPPSLSLIDRIHSLRLASQVRLLTKPTRRMPHSSIQRWYHAAFFWRVDR